MLDRLGNRFSKRRPADRYHRIHHRIFHQKYCFTEQEYLYFVSGFRKCLRVKKREGCFRGVIRSPGALFTTVFLLMISQLD
jgi:hypothetical protein